MSRYLFVDVEVKPSDNVFPKTNIPITLLAFESANDVWGRTTNPHHKDFAPGGSTGGEAALLAYGGSRLGIGTDVAGSVRVPAHYSGIYTIKCSAYRFPKTGGVSGMPGQEGIPPVYAPMTRTLEDLETFWKAVVSMKPWDYDPSVRTTDFVISHCVIASNSRYLSVCSDTMERCGIFEGQTDQMGRDAGRRSRATLSGLLTCTATSRKGVNSRRSRRSHCVC